MTLEELNQRLQSTGLPVTYRAWPDDPESPPPPEPPFICYLCEDDDPLFADGTTYYFYSNVRVELYTKYKSPELETKVESALAGFHWKKSETYISTERCYLIIYEIEV